MSYGVKTEINNVSTKEAEKLINEDRREELVRKGIGLIYHIINKKYKFRDDKDDLFQVGAIGLIKATRNFNPGRGEWPTYAYRCIDLTIRTYVREDHIIKPSRKNPEYKNVISLNQETGNDVDVPLLELMAVEDERFSAKELVLDMQRAMRYFNARHKKIFWLRAQGYTAPEIADMMGYSHRTSIYHIDRKIKDSIRKECAI